MHTEIKWEELINYLLTQVVDIERLDGMTIRLRFAIITVRHSDRPLRAYENWTPQLSLHIFIMCNNLHCIILLPQLPPTLIPFFELLHYLCVLISVQVLIPIFVMICWYTYMVPQFSLILHNYVYTCVLIFTFTYFTCRPPHCSPAV